MGCVDRWNVHLDLLGLRKTWNAVSGEQRSPSRRRPLHPYFLPPASTCEAGDPEWIKSARVRSIISLTHTGYTSTCTAREMDLKSHARDFVHTYLEPGQPE